MSHHVERCECGAILRVPAELDTGVCLACLARGECAPAQPQEPVEDFEWEAEEATK